MKKLLVGMLMLISVGVFAHGVRGNFDGQRQSNKNFSQRGTMRREDFDQRPNQRYEELTEKQQEELEELRKKIRDANDELILDLKSNNLEIQRLMIEDEINWIKVEKLLEEKAELEIKLELSRLKHREEVKEIIGEDFPMGSRRGLGDKRSGTSGMRNRR
ncbi:MAG: hypothetical protein ACQERZ_05675 [Fusobacteriota bacterium]